MRPRATTRVPACERVASGSDVYEPGRTPSASAAAESPTFLVLRFDLTASTSATLTDVVSARYCGDVHALAPAPPGAHLLGRRPERLGRLGLVPPPVEAEGRLEQWHRAEPLLPTGFLSLRRRRELLCVGNGARVGEHGSLQVLERDPQERGDAHHLVERRLARPARAPSPRSCRR